MEHEKQIFAAVESQHSNEYVDNTTEPTVLRYNLSNIRELSAEDISRIEIEISKQINSGLSADEAQDFVNAQLEQLGLDPASAHDNVMVIRFVDNEGNSHVRPINTSALDFGTRVNNIELQPVESPASIDEMTPEEKAAQERYVDAVVAQQLDATRFLSHALEENSTFYGRNHDEVTNELIAGIKSFTDGLSRGEPVSDDAVARLVETVIPEVQRLVSDESESSFDGRRRVASYLDELDETTKTVDKNLDGPYRDEVHRVLGEVSVAARNILKNRQMEHEVCVEMLQNLSQLSQSLQYNQYDVETLRVEVAKFEGLIQQQNLLRSSVPQDIEGLKKTLTRQ